MQRVQNSESRRSEIVAALFPSSTSYAPCCTPLFVSECSSSSLDEHSEKNGIIRELFPNVDLLITPFHIIGFSKKQSCFTYGDILGLMQKAGREDCQEVCLRVTLTPLPIHLTSSYHNYFSLSIFHVLSSFSAKKMIFQATSKHTHFPHFFLECMQSTNF